MTHKVARNWPFLSLPHVDVIFDLLWTNARQYGIYLLNLFIYSFIYFFILAWYWLKPATLLLSLWHCWIKWNIPTSSYWGASGCHDRNLSQKPLLNRSLADHSIAQLHVFAWALKFKDKSAREIWFLFIFVWVSSSMV